MKEINWKKDALPCITQSIDGLVLSPYFTNREAFERTLETGNLWRYSVSQGKLIEVGSSSGKREYPVEIRTNCNGDALLMKVRQEKPYACHEGYASCFSWRLAESGLFEPCEERVVDPKEVYK